MSCKAQSYFASSISNEKSMLKLKLIKKVTALCCAFAVSLTGLPEIHANAQTKEMQCEIQQTGSTVKKQGIVHTLATKTVNKESELRDAIASCPAGGTVTIDVTSSFKITKGIVIDGNKSVLINGVNPSGNGKRVIGTNEEIVRLFAVEKGSAVIFTNMILKGGTSSSTGEVSYRTTGAVLVAEGGHIQLNYCEIRYSNGALVNIKDSGIVTATYTVFSDARGTINDCGGAVRIASGTFNMCEGSQIINNSYGGVYVSSNGTFTMNDGYISGNEKGAGYVAGGANYGMGGGVFCNGTFNFLKGTIEGNRAFISGSGIVISETGNMKVSSGAHLVNTGDKANELVTYTSNLTFNSAPVSPMKTKLGYAVSIGQEIAKCASSVRAEACMQIDGVTLRNDPMNQGSIIGSGDYLITYESDGAIGKETITVPGVYNTSFSLPEDYQKVGYTLVGWRKNAEGEILAPGSAQTVLGDVTYYPVWQSKDIKVEYYGENGLELGMTGSYNFANQSDYIIESADKKEGYDFLYWLDISEGAPADKHYQANSALSRTEQDTTLRLKAVYEAKQITVHFNLNRENAKMTESSTIAVNYMDYYFLGSHMPTATGYTFAGWYTDQDCVGQKLSSVCPANLKTESTIELYAKWEVKDVPVTYDTAVMNGKSTVKYDGKLTLPEAANKTGYTFKGWYLNGDKSKIYSAKQEICPKTLGITSIELTAVFDKSASTTITPGKTPSSNGSTTTTGGTTTYNKTTNATASAGTVAISTTATPRPSASTNEWLKLNVNKKKIGVGDQFNIKVSANESYEFSTDSDCITVNNSGFVKAIKPGTAVVEVKTSNSTQKCTVVVKAAPKASDLKVKAKKVKKGKSISVKPTFIKNTYCMAVTYASSNKKVATVSSSGQVKGLKKGTAKITIKCSTGAKKVIKIRVV